MAVVAGSSNSFNDVLHMDAEERRLWSHDHTFGQDVRRAGESRTLWVILLTAVMMVVEIAAGIIYGSMALLADGLHMASHTAALGISFFAYIYARRNAADPRFSFGTGKVNALGGFTGALLLALFALGMVWESCDRLISPVTIAYDQAILVAILGLVVNGVSVFILGGGEGANQGMVTLIRIHIPTLIPIPTLIRMDRVMMASGMGIRICVRPICMCWPMR